MKQKAPSLFIIGYLTWMIFILIVVCYTLTYAAAGGFSVWR